MNRVWVISATPERSAQARILMQSIAEHSSGMIQLINPLINAPPRKSITELVVLSRLRAALVHLESGTDEVIVLGADNFFYSDPMEIGHTYAGREALFIPHCQEWLPAPHNQNRSLMRAGVINSDLHVWRNTPKVRSFLRTIIIEIDHGPLHNAFEMEQWWLPHCLSHLDAELIRHPGYGVSYYNMHEREIFGDPTKPVVRRTNGVVGDLRNMHYSGMTFKATSPLLTDYPLPFLRQINQVEYLIFSEYREKVRNKMTLDAQIEIAKT